MPLHPNLPGIGVNPFRVGGAAPPAWTPASLPDLELWLPNSFLATIGDAQPIAQWDDASGNARHAVQATATSRPTARLTGDKWEAKGDGVDDFLVSTFGATFTQPNTVWCVGSIAALSQDMLGPATGGYHALARDSGGRFQAYAGNPTFDHSPTGDASVHSFVIIFNGAATAFRIDGVEVVGTTGADSVASLVLLAATNTGVRANAGVLRDAGLCSSILVGDDLTNLETYLASLV